MRVISLGWGVQSFTMAAMVALGDLPPIDVAIYADTTHERSETYKFAANWTPWLEEHGIRIVTVKDEYFDPSRNKYGRPQIPVFADSKKGGQIRRECTRNWKITPTRHWLQANRNRDPVELWIGISWDESQRMKDSDVKYIVNRWPLIEKRMTRNDCKIWLTAHGLEIPPRSACVFCPFHNLAEWHDIKTSGDGDWQKAVEVDRAIRRTVPPYDCFLHRLLQPLDEIDLRTEQERGQLSLWDEECSGLCGV